MAMKPQIRDLKTMLRKGRRRAERRIEARVAKEKALGINKRNSSTTQAVLARREAERKRRTERNKRRNATRGEDTRPQEGLSDG